MSIAKHVVRYGVIAGLVGGTAALVAGPDRLGALFTQLQQRVNSSIDCAIDDPIALRAQMKRLEGEYPERISEVRGDLAQLREQRSQLQRERAVSERVVSLAGADLEQMQGLIGKAESAQAGYAQNVSFDGAQGRATVIRVVFNGESIDMKQAYTRANKIQQVKAAYSGRLAEIDRDLGYLGQQETRLAQLSEQLMTEHQEFQAQMWQMDRQVDSISRNERLIGMMEKRQETLDEQGRYRSNSLEQLSSRFADIRAKQEAKLEVLGQSSNATNYEDRAKFDLDAAASYRGGGGGGTSGGGASTLAPMPLLPNVIEITPATPDVDTSAGSAAPAGYVPARKRTL